MREFRERTRDASLEVAAVVVVSVLWIVGLAVVYFAFLWADALIIREARNLFSEAVGRSRIVQFAIEQLENLSAVGAAAAYAIHTIKVVYRIADH